MPPVPMLNYLQQMMYSKMIPPYIYYTGYPPVVSPPVKTGLLPQKPQLQPSEASRRGSTKRAATHIAIAYFISNDQAKPFPPEVPATLKRVKIEQPLLS
jgi:hypothetical protein